VTAVFNDGLADVSIGNEKLATAAAAAVKGLANSDDGLNISRPKQLSLLSSCGCEPLARKTVVHKACHRRDEFATLLCAAISFSFI